MKIIQTEIEISTTPDYLWKILLDFEKYPDWNPFIREAFGERKEGSRLKMRVNLPNGSAMTFRPNVKTVETNRELSWLGHFLIPGLFDGEHHFEIKELNNDKVRFIQWEKFSGILVPLLWRSMGPKTKKGFELMNEAIKARAENR